MIRIASLEDAEAIAGLSGELGYATRTDEMRQRLASLTFNDVVFVSNEEGVSGWLHAAVVRSLETEAFVEIRGLVVSERRRSSGIGAQLVAAAEQWARERGINRVRVRSNVIRERARKFYERLGYVVTKTQNVFDKTID